MVRPVALFLLVACASSAVAHDRGCWSIDRIHVAAVAERGNEFTARVMNRCPVLDTLQLDLRALPGQWVRWAWQRQFKFVLAPGERRVIQAEFDIQRLTPEATLRVTFGPLDHYFLRKTYDIGRNNRHARDLRAGLASVHTRHLDLYASPGSFAAQRLSRIGREREAALDSIATMLGVSFKDRVELVFYPDSASKVEETGHIGAGLAFGNTIVEIYNERVQLDPYHELVHVVARKLGEPPALFNEGLAVYASERLGGDALRSLGHPGQRVDDVARQLRAQGRLLHLDSLLHFNEIGSEESQPLISYPEAASFVKYLIQQRGLSEFRQAYKQLMATDDSAQWRVNEQELQRIYGATVPELERGWLASLG